MHTATMAVPLLALLTLSAPSLASDRYCKHEAPRQLTLDVGDARTVVFDIGQQTHDGLSGPAVPDDPIAANLAGDDGRGNGGQPEAARVGAPGA